MGRKSEIEAAHPGRILRDEMEARGINPNRLADQIGVSGTHVSEIIKGRRGITTRTAMKLEKALGVEARLWCHLQTEHDISKIDPADYESIKEL